MKILICTIVRNAELTIQRWWENVTKIATLYPEIEFSISVYENDSVDNSKNLLTEVMKDSSAYFSETFLGLEDLQTDFYESVVDGVRVENLAKARNNCFDQVKNLDEYDYVLSVEVDAHFTVSSLGLLFQKIGQWDILFMTIGLHALPIKKICGIMKLQRVRLCSKVHYLPYILKLWFPIK